MGGRCTTLHLRVPVADAVARRASITVDLLCFSAQFYCTTAMIRRSDVRFDSVITWIFADLVKHFCLKMADILEIWMRKSLENQRRNWSRSSWRP